VAERSTSSGVAETVMVVCSSVDADGARSTAQTTWSALVDAVGSADTKPRPTGMVWEIRSAATGAVPRLVTVIV